MQSSIMLCTCDGCWIKIRGKQHAASPCVALLFLWTRLGHVMPARRVKKRRKKVAKSHGSTSLVAEAIHGPGRVQGELTHRLQLQRITNMKQQGGASQTLSLVSAISRRTHSLALSCFPNAERALARSTMRFSARLPRPIRRMQ